MSVTKDNIISLLSALALFIVTVPTSIVLFFWLYFQPLGSSLANLGFKAPLLILGLNLLIAVFFVLWGFLDRANVRLAVLRIMAIVDFAVVLLAFLLFGVTWGLWSRAPLIIQHGDSLLTLKIMRQRVADYRKLHGKYPERLEDLRRHQPLHRQEIWATDPHTGGLHRHLETDAVQNLSTADEDGVPVFPPDMEDTGGWGYDPATGHVFIACHGLSEKLGRPMHSF